MTGKGRRVIMDPLLKYYCVMPISLMWALVSIHGGRKGWKCFIEPPACLERVHSHALLQALFGADVIRNAALISGWISLGIAFYVMYCL
jgi:hypothetical protein